MHDLEQILAVITFLGPKDVAGGVNTRVSTPTTPADEQLVPSSDNVTVECSCGFDGVCKLFS